MKAKELRELAPAELEKKIRDARKAQLDDRLKNQTGQLEKSHILKARRREIARMETILRQKASA